MAGFTEGTAWRIRHAAMGSATVVLLFEMLSSDAAEAEACVRLSGYVRVTNR